MFLNCDTILTRKGIFVIVCKDRGYASFPASFSLSRLLELFKIFYSFMWILKHICQKQTNQENNVNNHELEDGF